MIEHPSDWTFAAVLELWDRAKHRYDPEMLKELAQATYEWAADASGRSLNPSRIVVDRTKLDEILQDVRAVVDTTIAHADNRAASASTMTVKELDEAIYAVEELAKRYISLVTDRGYSLEPGSMTPYEQAPWYRIFEAWRDLDTNSFRPRPRKAAVAP